MIVDADLSESAYFDSQRNPHHDHVAPEDNHQFRLPVIPVELRLRENKERRMAIEQERKKEKDEIIRKRREKEENVQRILRERSEARQNAKLMFEPCMRTCGNGFDAELNWRREEEIDGKIEQSRNRAEMYKTLYKRKLHNKMEQKERNARANKQSKQNKQLESSLNYHLAEWNEYEKKIAQKYKGEKINEKRLYETYMKKEIEIVQLLEESKKNGNRQTTDDESKGSHKRLLGDRTQKARQSAKPHLPANLCEASVQISTFGIQKSIKNPEKMLKEMMAYVQDRVGLEAPAEDAVLLEKFEEYLEKGCDL